MEETEECVPVIVEGVWSAAQTKTVKNKLQLYFHSKKKSGGGECRVEAEEGAPRAAVYFRGEDVRERVLARKNHEITVDNQAVTLRLSSAPSPADDADVSDSATDSKMPESEVEPGDGASAEKQDESIQSFSVVLDNVGSNMSRDLLMMLVETISGLDDSFYSLEIILESNRAVVTFKSPADVEKFLTVSQTSQKLQKRKLTAWKLEEAKSVRVESLPSAVVEDLLELFFEKNWALPENITMVPDEEAAIVTFVDPKVVKNICIKQDYMIGSTPVKVYPYYESLGTALYGKERPTWKMPEPFTEGVHPVICHPSSNSQKLTITGLSAAVSKTKAWILERKLVGSPTSDDDVPECIQSFSVVLDNVGSNMSRDLLLMLVETISGLDDSFYSLEIILESNRAVVTFKSPADVEKFLTVSQTSQKLQKHKLTAWKLEETKSVRVESLPSAVVEDLLELFFEKNWALPENITMVPDEEAAIVTFVDPKVVKNICIKQDYMIGSTPVKVYPYYESLGTALYGKERPTWKMPEPFTEGVHPVICHPSSNSQKLTITGLSAAVSKTKAWILERNSPTSDDDVPECIQSFSVVLDNVGSNMSRDLLLMLVETISGLDDSFYSLEIILESNRAVVTFKSPADVEKFLTVSQTSQKLQKHKLTAWKLEETKSVRVESLPSAVIEDLLELFFEKNWALPENITMVPDEEAAIVTFVDPKVVKNICIKQDYMIGSTPVKVYPYYESLGTALYGKERPTWKMPEPFTEGVHPVIWKFLQMKKLSNKINNLMRPYFCSVNMENPEVKLSPIPNFLRQKGLTAQQVDMWKSTAQDAFRQHMSQYTAFECTTNRPAWKAAEKDVRSIVREDAHLVLDASRGVLTVAGKADNVKTFRVSVENIVSKALSQIERQTNGVSEVMDLSPALFYILQQEGIQKATQDISLEMNLSYDKNSQNLTITGFSAEVSKTKAWILERNVGRSKKQIELHSGLLDFLKTVDPMDMSHHLFTSHGISAIFSVESKGVLLLGSSEGALAGAERKINASLTVMMLDVEDQAVLNLPNWVDLNRQLLDTYNSSKKKTVTIQIYPGRQDQITVAGFLNPVKEVSRNLSEFIKCYSRIEERIRLQSAVIEFINKKKTLEWSSIAKDNDVKVNLDPLRQRIYITGARLHVQKAKSCLEELTSSLFSDNLRMNKPGAKKYFQSQENWFQVSIMSEFSCVVMLHPENQEEEEEENYEDENGFIYCKVKTAGGVLVSVSKADICHFGVDAVVNAANEELQHIGGLALAMLKAAGPELQKISNNYVSKNGKLRPSDAIVTSACNLPCKYIVHAVGPRFSDYDKKTAVSRLKLAVRESLRKAVSVNCSTVALPAISSGLFGFPVDLCAETIAEAVREYCDSPESRGSLTEIHLVDNNDNTVRVLAAAFNKEFSDLGPTMTIPPQSGGQSSRASGRYQRGRGRGGQWQSPRGHQFNEKGGQGYQGRFTRDFKGQTGQRNFQHEAPEFSHPAGQSFRQSLQSSASFGQVGSPSLGVYQMQMGTLTLEVSSGDITKETCDVIINASNQTFNLQSGVSKAILDSAGMSVQMECAQIVSSPGYQPSSMIVTSAGQLPSRNIIHIVGQSDPVKIKEMVYSVLKICEENKFKSVAFPALGTGQGGANPSLVADAMVDAVVDFVRKKRPKSVQSVKILIFQTFMVMEFHKCMKKREGEGVEEKGFFTKIKVDKRTRPGNLDLETEEFEPTEFELCADDKMALVLAKKRIEKLILDEQAEKTIQDQYISQLSQEDMEKLKDLQRNLTVSIRLDKGQKDKEPKIHLEGLTRDVSTAESTIREIIQRVERQENLRSKAILVSSLVEWQFQHPNGNNVPFDIFTNLKLEEALEKKEKLVNIKINNENYKADVKLSRAISANGHKMVELLRKDLKSDAPLLSNWEDMKGDLLKLFALTARSKEYKDVETEVTKTGLTITIISIERVQSPTLWQSYQLKKKHMEKKNNHTNNERRLFHGTGADAIDLINKDGFNRSYAGKHAAMYGNGTYFAVDPCYSAKGYARPDTRGHKRMYLARVLVGDFTRGASGMLAPPPKSGNTSDLYDSVTDNKSSPSMFIVFNDTHAYPEYLITFT